MSVKRCPLLLLVTCSLVGGALRAPERSGVGSFQLSAPRQPWQLRTNRSFLLKKRGGERGLARCKTAAVCGMVQANAWGVSSEQFCRCEGGQACPLIWDPQDGRSVTHGSDQYKYCHRAPPLSDCGPGQLAMKDELISLKMMEESGMQQMTHHEYIFCRCPAGHQLTQTDNEWTEDEFSDTVITSKSCTKMPRCSANQHCKFVTKSPRASLVQVNCVCSAGQTCPTITDQYVDTQEFGKGTIYSILCR